MQKILGMVLALLLGLGVAGAWADEIAGKIQSIDPADRVVLLEDGTRLWVAEGLSLDALKDGASVKASYEERDGKKVITEFKVAE